MALAPLGSAVSVDFIIALTGRAKVARPFVYMIGVAATLLALFMGAGEFFETSEGLRGFRYEGAGLLAVAAAIALAAFGNGLLVDALRDAKGKRRREIAIVLASSLIGLSTVVSFAPPIFGHFVAPWSILALPIYPAILVYAILRYELMAANVWARRAAGYALLLLAAAVLAGLLAAAPLSLIAPATGFFSLWLVVASAMTCAFALGSPIRRLADRIVFAEAEISAETMANWRAALLQVDSPQEAMSVASRHLRNAMRLPVEARLGTSGPEPALCCEKTARGWVARIQGFDDAPPGARRIAIVYGDLLAQALEEAQRRRRRAEQERLAELGLLASTIAHDLRNPLNIVNMAAAGAPKAVRTEILEQTRRMNRLVAELLDYAKPWTLEPVAIDLAQALSGVEAHMEAGATLNADPLRLAQALENLLANARAAGARTQVFVERADGATLIHVCDDGPGVPEDLKDRLFQPFISRSNEGTGLGLAIVAKIMTAHGGTAALGRRPGFSTCITLRFPP